MKSITKIFSILLVTIMLTMVSVPCFAASGVLDEVATETNSMPYTNIKAYENINETAGKVIKIIRYVAIVIAVVLIAIFGIKFMLGSAEEKAEYKKSFVPLIIGIVVVFGATYIAQVIFSITGN